MQFTVEEVRNKLTALKNLFYKISRDDKHQTGYGADCAMYDTYRSQILAMFPYCDVYDEIYSCRANITPGYVYSLTQGTLRGSQVESDVQTEGLKNEISADTFNFKSEFDDSNVDLDLIEEDNPILVPPSKKSKNCLIKQPKEKSKKKYCLIGI